MNSVAKLGVLMARQIIKIDVRAIKSDIAKLKADVAVVGLFSNAPNTAFLGRLDAKLDGAIARLKKIGDFKGTAGSSIFIYTRGKIAAERLLLIGLGEKQKVTVDTIRQAAAKAAFEAVNIKAKTLAVFRHNEFAKIDLEELGQAIAEGIHFGGYRYDEFITQQQDGRSTSLSAVIVGDTMANVAKLNKGIKIGQIIGKAQNFARTLANRPGNVINPLALADEARKLARTTPRLSCKALDEKQMARLGMGGILAVGGGSKTPPRLIVVRYTPTYRALGKLPTVALVGKAITFDSGGINIKPGHGMDQMKLDKTGGIAVLATIKAAAELKLPLNLYAVVPAAENMPSGYSYRPGDIVKTYSGKTVEVLDTDAEGRMILCDGLAYARRLGCDIIVDIATLTGACKVALGKYMAGLMSNDEQLRRALEKAAQTSGEKVWPMPSGEEYLGDMKSKVADLGNLAAGGSKFGDACNAAAFLGQFVGDARWAHLDIAGVDCIEKPTGSAAEGASAFGVRLLATYLVNLVNKKDVK